MMNDELVKKYFLVEDLEALLKTMKKIKNAEKNKINVSLVRGGLRDLKEEIQKLSDGEKEIEKPNEIVDIVEKTLELNN